MYLCSNSPQLLNHDWTIELVQQLNGKVSNSRWTALIWLFNGNPEKTDFNSDGFKLLWEKEKNININDLKKWMHRKSKLKEKVIEAVPDAIDYYNKESSNTYDQNEEIEEESEFSSF